MKPPAENLEIRPPEKTEKPRARGREPGKVRMPRPSLRFGNWRIFLIEDSGAMMSFENARRIVAGILLIILTLSGLCAGLFWMYRGAEVERHSLSLRTADLERELAEIRHEKDLLTTRIVLNRSGAGESGDASDSRAAGNDPSLSAEARPEAVSTSRVAVREASVIPDRRGNALDIRFKLVNTGKDRVSGYVFAVLKPDAAHSATWRVVPQVALNAGQPASYEKGHEFSISRYNTMHLRAKHVASCALATLWVYSEDGALLLQHDIPSAR